MTLAEIKRAIESKARTERLEAQKHATYDYILAQLIGASVGRFIVGGDNVEYPTLENAYPSLFDDKVEEKKQILAERKAELSALRVKMFADFHNNRLREGTKN